MGIKLLNRFLKENCTNKSIYSIPISKLSNKIIAVDISIYLYKYESDNALIENIYTMISIFRYYNIIPIFIFDGMPPTEKKELIENRLQHKRNAEFEYNNLKLLLEKCGETEKNEIVEQMNTLKKKFVYMNKNKINKIKKLIEYYGMKYFDAPGEADHLCAMLVIKKKAWACLSDDTDMFVYGCNRVLRYFSILTHNVILYDYKNILKDLNISHFNFREICILSGTDYNINNNALSNSYNIFKLMQLYSIYRNTEKKEPYVAWICKTYDIQIDYNLLTKLKDMFVIKNNNYDINSYSYNYNENNTLSIYNLCELLKEEGFLFPYTKV
jgi:5'-3' exonuclease